MFNNYRNSLEPADEDTVRCSFFSLTFGTDGSLWDELCQELNNTIKTLSKDYIWHKDELKLYVPLGADTQNLGTPIHLHSHTCFGDNIEDEWFIVYLILEISKLHNHVIIQITDSDGDFLLIESADYLQIWATPDSTENRVFVYNGNIHIITPEVISLETKVDLNSALKIINESPESTKASSSIQQAILSRIGNYPEKLLEHVHKAGVYLPSNLAALFIVQPSLIAPIVDAYCNHDIIDVKSCKNINISDCVTVEVKFTKFLYAILTNAKLINSVKTYTSNNDKKHILGVKLMCGYQMIMNKASTDIYASNDYHRFIHNLKQNGYFKNNIEGSKQYKNLLEKAQEYFSLVECPVNPKLAHHINQLISTDIYKRIKASLKDHVVDSEYTGDSEDWLNIKHEELNEMLVNRYGKTVKVKNKDSISSQTVTTELSDFLKQTSDFEGIEPNHTECTEDENIDFESDQFIACLEKMLNLISSGSADNDEDSSNSDEEMNYEENDSDDCDRELKMKLQQDQNEDLQDNNTVLANIIQSMKEEKASAGPASNLLRSIDTHKSELLDSDDDVD